MDYKELYEHALEGIEEILSSGQDSIKMSLLKLRLQGIFPQLKESEDERVRKEIIAYVTLYKDSLGEEEYKSWIAWLEKQGEPTYINPSEFDLRLNKLLKQFETLPKEEIESSLAFYLNVVQNDGAYKEKQGEQKSNKGFTFKALPRLLDMIEPTDRAKAYCQKLIDSLLQERYFIDAKIVGECLKKMNGEDVPMATMDEKQGEQKLAAWSSEDEIKLTTACVFLKNSKLKDVDEIRESTIKWLQSLKNRVQPQENVEWSDEDEKMLESIEGDILNADMVIGGRETAKLKIAWLKSLKQRIGG